MYRLAAKMTPEERTRLDEAVLSDYANTNIGKFEAIQVGLNEITASPIESLKTIQAEQLSKSNEIALVEKELAEGSLTIAEKAAKEAEKLDLELQFEGNISTLIQAKIDAKAAFDAKVAELEALNQSIDYQEDFETWQYIINKILLGTILQGEPLNSEEAYWVDVVANQCPTCGGDVVFQAREILRDLNPNVTFDDVLLCGNANARIRYKEPILPSFSLSPNPANDFVQIQIKNAYRKKNLAIQITDLMGQTVKVVDGLDIHSASLVELGDLPPAIYILTLFEGDKVLQSEKLTILR